MFQVDDRVQIVECAELTGRTGTILGKAIDGPVPFWIVLLDEPLPENKALMVIDSCLRFLD